MDPNKNLPRTTLKPLTIENVLELWSRTYNTSGKPDWSHIFPYYHEDIVFQDSIQKVDGENGFYGHVQPADRQLRRTENGYFFDRRRQQ